MKKIKLLLFLVTLFSVINVSALTSKERMQSYKEKFNRDQFVLSVKATCDFDSSMEIVYDENSILYEYLDDDDMLID